MFLDLASIYFIQLSEEGSEIGSIKVTNSIIQMWNISKDELDEQAKENIKYEMYQIKSMKEIFLDMLICNGEKQELVDELIEEDNPPMFVLSNHKKINGAAGLFEIDILKTFAKEIGKNFYILPSSIHELILIPEERGIKVEELKQMVCEVNETQVSEEEFLSNLVYYYNSKKNDIEYAK